MPQVKITKKVAHRWADLFKLVLDVESYPAFVPHCREVRLLSRRAESSTGTVIVSRMTVGLSALQVSYANQTNGDFAARTIKVKAIDGPLRWLRVVWRFNPAGDDATEIDFSANFEFNNLVLAALASRVFSSMFEEIVNAFERRADRLFGRRGGSRHQMASGTMVMAPQGHSCAQTPQPLQKS
jgi:coenzyme Q-binding protein COQ10